MESEIQESNGVMGNGGLPREGDRTGLLTSPPGSAVAQRPHRRRKIRVEVEIPEALMGEFDLMVQEVLAGPRTRLTLLEQEFKAIETRALAGLQVIATTVRAHPGTGQTRRLVRFLAGLYDGPCYPLDLSELRGLDTALANACVDYLNYDRLAIYTVDHHVPGGERALEDWIADYGCVPCEREG